MGEGTQREANAAQVDDTSKSITDCK